MTAADYHRHYDELVDLIYNIPVLADGWKIFLSRLNQILHSTNIHVQAIDFQRQAFSFSQCGSILPETEMAAIEVEYLHYPTSSDPRWNNFLDPSRKGWYQCHQHLSNQMVAKSEIFQKVLLPAQIRFNATHELYWDDELCVFIGIDTSLQRQPLTVDELNFLDKLLVHLKRIVLLQKHVFEFSKKAIVGYALIDKLSQPIMLLHLNGEISHINDAMSKLLIKNDLIKVEQHFLQLPATYQQQLSESLKLIETAFKCQDILLVQQLEDSCIKITSDLGEVLYIFASLLVSEKEIQAFGIRPQVMLTFYSPTQCVTIDPKILHSAFALTPTESKIALQLLEGMLPKQIASQYAIRVDTVHKHIKSIYKKTATKRQAELVKLLLNMPRYNINSSI